MTRIVERRRGAVAVVVAISLVALLGIVAIVIDGGMLLDQRRQCQAAADAAALAAANDLFINYRTNVGVDVSGSAAKAAKTYATLNGYSDDEYPIDVDVQIPPLTGNYAGKPGYVEVTLTAWQNRGFSNIFGGGTIPVQARAVARGKYVAGQYGVVILDPSSTDTCEINGQLNIIGSGQINVNSSDPAAIQFFNSGQITATDIYVNGSPGYSNSTSPYINSPITATVHTGASPVADPLLGIPEPTPSGTDYGSVTLSGTKTINPGRYSKITISNNAIVTMNPGIYYIKGPASTGSYGGIFAFAQQGGIIMGTGSTLTGTGVMIYNASGDNLNFAKGGTVNITPPTTGIYMGISIWQPRSDPSEIHLIHTSSFTMLGTLYAATGLFDLRPTGTTCVFNMGNYVCWQFETNQAGSDFGNGGGTTGVTNLDPTKAAPTLRSIQLVE